MVRTTLTRWFRARKDPRPVPGPAPPPAPDPTDDADAVIARATSPENVSAVLAELESVGADLSDGDFVAAAYGRVLGRVVDDYGAASNVEMLRAGAGRDAVVDGLLRSEEHLNRLLAEHHHIPSLREEAPDRFEVASSRPDGQEIPVIRVETNADFDWLEQAILENGYYEKPGVWSLGVDVDKRVMAEILAAFEPERALEIGCASGAVMQCLHELGVGVEGAEISHMAVERSSPGVRSSIHVGDVLALGLEPHFDLVYGLDVFEHLNPNRLHEYLAELARLLGPGGFVYANIPAFGADEVFGTVFPLFLDEWRRAADSGRNFSRLQVDDDGYPMHGHLIWADTRWWVEQFVRAGLRRVPEIELALHSKYDDYMNRASVSRRALYVFARGPVAAQVATIVEHITSTPSAAIPGTRDGVPPRS